MITTDSAGRDDTHNTRDNPRAAGAASDRGAQPPGRRAVFTAAEANPCWWPKVLDVLARDYPEINDKVWSTAIGENAAERVAERERQ